MKQEYLRPTIDVLLLQTEAIADSTSIGADTGDDWGHDGEGDG